MISQPLGGVRKEISLRSRTRSLAFLIPIVCASAMVATQALLAWASSSFENPGVGRWISHLDGNDPRLEHQWGQAYLPFDTAEGLRHLRRATQLSPLNRLYWEDFESACESSGDLRCPEEAGERLVALCPRVPSYQWIAAQTYLQTNRLDAALVHIRRLLELDPNYAEEAWYALRNSLHDPEAVFEKVLARNPDAEIKVGYVDFLSDQGNKDAAYRIWRRVVANSPPFPFASAEPYLDRLIDSGRIDEAVNVWKDLDRLGIVHGSEARQQGNLVFNGDFEQTPLDAGFDWRTGQTTYLVVDFSAPEAYHGGHCLRVDFTVRRNEEYEPVYQIVPVLPRHTYALEAFVRSEAITSDSGPRLRVRDTQAAGFPEVTTETTVGTTPWHRVRLRFATGPKTRAMRVSFWRPRSDVFPPQISGTFWLDTVSIQCLGDGQSGRSTQMEAARDEAGEAPGVIH